MLKNKVILIISPDSWDFVSVSKHHYARELAKVNTVYFLNTPNKKQDFKVDNVFVLNQYKKVKGLSKLKGEIIKKPLMKIEVNSILETTGKIDIVWSFDSSRLYYLDLFKAKCRIAHLVDFTENFHLKELLNSSSIAFATSDSIIENISKFQPHVFKLNHGFKQDLGCEEVVLPGNNQVKGIYIGNLSIKYLDWRIAKKLALNNKAVDFVFIGPVSSHLNSEQEDIMKLDNVYFLPPVPANVVSSYLMLATFSLVLYSAEKYYDQLQNPHKIMQYLGAGLPIFSSLTHEFIGKNLLCMYENKDNVLSNFDAFLAKDSVYFTEKHKQQRTTYALNNTYAKQIERIEGLLGDLKIL